MAAYVIFIRDRMRDDQTFASYVSEAGKTIAGRGVRLLAMNGECVAVEGPDSGGVLILEFPNMAGARAWYDSPAYVKARSLRQMSADYRVLIVDGVIPSAGDHAPHAKAEISEILHKRTQATP